MSVVAQSKCKLSYQVKRSWILETIRDRKMISRNDLAEVTGLSAPVITRLTKELLEENFIEEVGKEQIDIGRRPTLLSLSKSTKFLIGIDVGAYESKAVLTNLNSETIRQCCGLTPRDPDGKSFIDFLLGLIRNLLNEGRITPDLLQGIVLAFSGLFNSGTGEVLLACNVPALRNLQICEPLKAEFRVPVIITHTAGVWALSECERAQKDQKDKDFIIAYGGYGLGLLPLFNSEIPSSRIPKAKIDFGHISLDPNGPGCNCGSRGCLEAFASAWAIERNARTNPSRQLLEMVDGKKEAITAKDVFDTALRGDRTCFNLVREAGTLLGQHLALFVQYYNPNRVVFTGGLMVHNTLYFDTIIQEMSRRIPKDRFMQIEMQVTTLDKFAGAVGATRLLAHEILHAPVEDLVRVAW